MLRHSARLPDEARLLEHAVERALVSGARTADIAATGDAPIGTVAMGDAILAALEALHVAAPRSAG